MGFLSSLKGKGVDRIFVFLGNPGKDYEGTRHNVGFMALDYIAKKEGFTVKKAKFSALTEQRQFFGKRVLFLKPQTYMNNSGEAVRRAADFYKVSPDCITVVYDDVALGTGKIRIRKKGSAGGHNGIKSIISHLGSEDFGRIRIGVGENAGGDLADWVLSRIPKSDMASFDEAFEKTYEALGLITDGRTDAAMNKLN